MTWFSDSAAWSLFGNDSSLCSHHFNWGLLWATLTESVCTTRRQMFFVPFSHLCPPPPIPVQTSHMKCFEIHIWELVTETLSPLANTAAWWISYWNWIDEGLGKEGCMDVWVACMCGQHGCVVCMNMWAARICGLHECMSCVYVWASWMCRLHVCVVCMDVSDNSDPGRKEANGREECSVAWGGKGWLHPWQDIPRSLLEEHPTDVLLVGAVLGTWC